MRLGSFFTFWLVYVQLPSFMDASEKIETDMERIFDRIAKERLSSLKRSISGAMDRQKRELGVKKVSLIDDSGVYRLVSLKPVSRLCHPAIRTLFLDVSNMTYAVCISSLASDGASEVVVGYYKEHQWIPFQRWYVNKADDAAAFYYKNYIYVLVTDSERKSGTELKMINLTSNELINYHDVTSSYATSISLWKLKITGQYNLAIANSGGFRDGFKSKVSVFEWKNTYFDPYASLDAYAVKDIEPFHIHGSAYIAIANFQKSRNDYEVDSEIFAARYDQEPMKWISHQKIKSYGAMDWEFFSLGTSLGQEFFLALANRESGESNVKSMIYKFVDDKFVPFQCLPTSRAVSLASYSTDGKFLLAVANEDDAVHLYQYDGWRFVRSGVQSTSGAMSDGVKHLMFHSVTRNLEKALILSVSNPRHYYYPSVFEIGFAHENILDDWYQRATDWCLNTLEKLESTDVDKTFDFSDVIFIDQPSITIDGDVIFEKGFETNTLTTPKFKDISTQEVFDDNLLNKLANLQERLKSIKQKLEGFSTILDNAITTEGDQIIQSHIQFEDAVFSCRSQACHFENIHTEVLNGEEIADWSSRLVFLDSEQFINGTIMAKEINATSVSVLGFIDGVKSDNLVTKSGHHSPITGHKTFKNVVETQDLHVYGKLDGVVISPNTVLLSTGHQNISGNISFESLTTTWIRTKFLNDKNFSEFYNDLVLTDKSTPILGKKIFNDVTVGALVLTPGSTINGVDFVDLWKNTFWTDGNQEILAEMTFSDVVLDKDLFVTYGINGIQIPGPRIVDITEPAVITAPYVFKNSTKIRSLDVLESVNGMSLVFAPDGSKQLDIMLKTGNQIVTGAKTFHTIHLDANSDVKGLVDGVDLSEFQAAVLRKTPSVTANGTWTFQNLIIRGPLTIGGKFSNVDLRDVYNRALRLNEPFIPEMSFKSNVYVEDLQSKNINGIDVRRDLVLKNEPQTIYGKKTFNAVILENGSTIGSVNNINLNFLNEVLLVIGSQKIKSKILKKDVKINNLIVTGSINGVAIDDIVTLKGGKISGSRVLNNVTFSAIEAKNVEVTGRVNGIDIMEMIKDTMTYDGNEEVTGTKNVKGAISVVGDANLQTNDLNGVNFKALWDDAVFLDEPAEISGFVAFTDNTVFDSLSFNGTFDEVSDFEMKHNWMLRHKPQTVEGKVKFLNGFSAKDLSVRTVNGLDLHHLQSDIVKVNEVADIQGPVIFENIVISEGNVGLTGKIQGIDLSEEAVDRTNLIVTGEKMFSQDLIIEGDLTVDGLINDVDIEDLCNKTFLKSKEVNITRLVINGDLVLNEGIVEGNLAGIDLSLLKEIAVQDDGSEIKFGGEKTFDSITFEGMVTLKGKIGSVNLNELAQNYMSITKEQEIPAKMKFEDLAFKGILSVENLDTASKEINNINIKKLSDNILKTSGTQNVTAIYNIDEVHFIRDVFVAGKVNGLELPGGVMRHNHTNYIESPKIFEQAVFVNGNLDMERGKTIQGVDVSDWFQKAVLKEGKFEIHGYKTFIDLNLNDVVVEGKLDGLKISEKHLLMTYGDQIITGQKEITGSVNVEGSLTVHGLINMINITELANTTLQRDKNNTITGSKYFQQPLTIVSLQAPTVSGVDILALKEKLDTTLDLSVLENRLEEIENVVSHMQIAFDNQAVLFQYYELFDEFAIPSAYDWLYASGQDCGELLLLLDNHTSNAPCTSIRIFGLDKMSTAFIPSKQEIITLNAVSVRSLMLNSTTIFVANRNPNNPCSGSSDLDKTTVDIYSWNVDSFKKIQSVEAHHPIDMVTFKDEIRPCMVVLEMDGSKVYCSDENLNFTLSETLFTRGGQKVSLIQAARTILLAIAAEDVSIVPQNYVEGQRYVDIYEWDSANKQFSAPKQFIDSTFTQSLTFMKYTGKNSEEIFLAMADGSIPRINNEPKIVIYRYDGASDAFIKYQVIHDYGSLEWIALKTGELLLFAVDSQKGQVNVYQYKQASGFVKIDTIRSIGTTKVHAFIRPDPEDWLHHYLALVGPYSTMAQPTQGSYNAKILKSKVKGKRPVYPVY